MNDKCKCFEETLERLKDHVKKEKVPEGACDFNIEFEGATYFFIGGDYSPVNPKVKYEYRLPKKGGGYRANMTKGDSIVIASFCCFCGRKLKGKVS